MDKLWIFYVPPTENIHVVLQHADGALERIPCDGIETHKYSEVLSNALGVQYIDVTVRHHGITRYFKGTGPVTVEARLRDMLRYCFTVESESRMVANL